MPSNSYYHTLFNNAAELLRRDIKKNPPFAVEKQNLNELLALLNAWKTDVASLSSKKELASDNLDSFNAIPVLFEAMDDNRTALNSLGTSTNQGRERLLDIIFHFLTAFSEKDNLRRDTKKVLSNYFAVIASKYDDDSQFEEIEAIETEAEELNSFNYA